MFFPIYFLFILVHPKGFKWTVLCKDETVTDTHPERDFQPNSIVDLSFVYFLSLKSAFFINSVLNSDGNMFQTCGASKIWIHHDGQKFFV